MKIKKESYRNDPKKFILELPVGLIIIVIFLLITEICLAIISSSKGLLFSDLGQKQNDLERQNMEYTSILVSNTSLTKIAESAEKYGMIKPQTTLYLNKEEPVAVVPRL